MIATLPTSAPLPTVVARPYRDEKPVAPPQPPIAFQTLGPDTACNLDAVAGDAAMSEAQHWLRILRDGLQHEPYCVQAKRGDTVVGMLPLAFVKSALFGRFLVSLPYINSAGVIACDAKTASGLLDGAVQLADELNVRYLELRQEQEFAHASLGAANATKVLMRLPLPATAEALWNGFKAKLRSQIRSGQKHDFRVYWGREELLSDFYAVFSHNMRDLGTPVYSEQLFASVLREFGDQAEVCVLRRGEQAVAGAILLHYHDRTEVPSASSLRAVNSTNANMVMYWELLQRAVQRGQQLFDFGRSSAGSGTYRFKEQWGALPHPSVWQYYLRQGSASDMRPDNGKFGLAIRVWQRLPVAVTRLIGPTIVRGIP